MHGARLVVVIVLFSYSACETALNKTEEVCNVIETTAFCGEDFQLPENVKITKLTVRSSRLQKIEKQDLTKYENLEIIDFSNCGLQHIDHDSFISNEKLTDLNLAANKELKFPKEGPFISSKSLTKLNLSMITVEEISEMFFTDLPNLQVLELSLTSIQNFSKLISKLEHLTTLIISSSSNINITDLCKETHLNEIIQIEDGKEAKLNCTLTENTHKDEIEETSTKSEILTTITSTVLSNLGKDNEGKENIEEAQKKIAELQTTEITNTEQVNITKTSNKTETNTSTHDHFKTTEENNSTMKPDSKLPGQLDEDKPIEKQKPEDFNAYSTETEPTTQISEDVEKQINEDEKASTVHEEDQQNTLTNETDAKDVIQPSTANTEDDTGITVVLGIIIFVMAAAAIGFGYKYWKNRRSGYRNANTEDVEEGKELQSIVGRPAEREQN